MTDMLQKTENIAKNVANENSQDLTEQWKKGELPEGWYYVKCDDGICFDRFTYYGGFSKIFNYSVKQILAPVPSYTELQSMNEAVNQAMSANIKLQERVSKLEKMQYSYTPEEWNTMLRTVNRTKELLKECRSPINYALCLNLSEEEKIEFKNLLAKIKEVLND